MATNLLMDITSLGSTRIGQIASDGLNFVVTHVAYGTGGFNGGTPTDALALSAGATALGAEVFRQAVPLANTTIDTIETPRGKETTYTSLSGKDYSGIVGEAGLFATITDAGTTGLTVGSVFLLAHAHVPRQVLTETDHLALTWPIDYAGGLVCPADMELVDCTNVFVGNVALNNDAEILAFGANGYDGIDGHLDITEDAPGSITDLSPLTDLRVVDGYFSIYNISAGLTDLNGLAVVHAGEGLYVEALDTVTDISGLDSLVYVGGPIDILNMPGLVSMDGALPCLAEAPAYFNLSGFSSLTSMDNFAASLTTVADDFTINAMPVLASMTGAFPSLTEVGQRENSTQRVLLLQNLSTITSIGDAFTALTFAQLIHIIDCAGLSLAGCFPALTEVWERIYVDNYLGSGLSADNAFPALTTFSSTVNNEIDFEGDAFNTMLGAFPALTTFSAPRASGVIHVFDVQGPLTGSFNAFNPLAANGPGILILGVQDTTADFLNAAVTLHAVELYEMPLVSIDGFQSLVDVPDDGLLVADCTGVTVDLNGAFPLLETVGHDGSPTVAVLGLGNLGSGTVSLGGAFPSLTSAFRLKFDDLTAPTSFEDAFPALTTIAAAADGSGVVSDQTKQLEFQNCTGITTFDNAFPLLQAHATKPFYFDVTGMATLTTMNGAFAVTTRLGRLQVQNSGIQNFTGAFASLTTVAGSLVINNCDSLTSVAGLLGINGSLVTGPVTITNNNILPTTAQAQALIDNLVGEGYGGGTTNTGNGPG